jgi:hypothetical protein
MTNRVIHQYWFFVPLNGGDNRGGFLQHNLRVDIKQPAYQYKKELRYLYKKKATSIALNKCIITIEYQDGGKVQYY